MRFYVCCSIRQTLPFLLLSDASQIKLSKRAINSEHMDTAITAQRVQSRQVGTTEKELVVIEAAKKEILRGIFLFWISAVVFLFLRIFLEALGSDPQSIFAGFIYLVSSIYLLPYFGIFPNVHNTMQAGKPTFDSPAFTAILCYTILVLLAVVIVFIAFKMIKTGKQVSETVEKDHPVDPTKMEGVVK